MKHIYFITFSSNVVHSVSVFEKNLIESHILVVIISVRNILIIEDGVAPFKFDVNWQCSYYSINSLVTNTAWKCSTLPVTLTKPCSCSYLILMLSDIFSYSLSRFRASYMTIETLHVYSTCLYNCFVFLCHG